MSVLHQFIIGTARALAALTAFAAFAACVMLTAAPAIAAVPPGAAPIAAQ